MKQTKVVGIILFCLCVRTLSLPSFKMAANSKVDHTSASICCVPVSWQALMYLDYGNVFIDQNTAYSYMNGTVIIAFSLSLKKVYLGVQAVQQSPFEPKPIASNTTILYDFSTGIQYQVTDGKCDKSKLGTDMPRQCVPETATVLGTGKVGNGNISVTTYQFNSQSDLPFQVTATVFKHDLTPIIPMACEPIYVDYWTPSAEAGSGTLYGLNMLDFGKVKDSTLFNIPPECP